MANRRAGAPRNWKNRIVETTELPPEQIKLNPANWRKHPGFQQEVLGDVLAQIGWVQTVIINKRTGNLIDGHLRVEMALQHGEDVIPVAYVDLDDEEERLILATLDPITGLAQADNTKLRELLDGFESESDAINRLLGLTEANSRRILSIPTDKPPTLAWVLIGIPTVRYGEIAEDVHRIAGMGEDVFVETVLTEGD